MQLKIYRFLFWLSLILAVISIGFVVLLFVFHASLGSSLPYWIGGFVVYNILIVIGYKFLENNIDKIMLQKAAFRGEVVLANITGNKFICGMRDTSLKKYILQSIYVTYYDYDLKPHDTVIIEKLNYGNYEIPKGSVYMTYNPKHPDRGLIVQNVIISHIPKLAPLVRKYEDAKTIHVKYLDTHYDDGLVIRTFEETEKIEKEKAEVKAQIAKEQAEKEKQETKK
jgi:hypothetical protein